MMRYHLTQKSANGKTGPIAVTTSTRDNCPPSCPFYALGCYAKEGGPLALHWRAVTEGKRGSSFAEHLADLRALPAERFVRLNQAGDLPSAEEIPALADALQGRTAWTYTHHRDEERLSAVRWVNARASVERGLVINLSANNPADADALNASDPDAPIAVIIPQDAPKTFTTAGGLRIVSCPEQTGACTSCATCGNGTPLCARAERTYAIGFRAHGRASKHVDSISREV